VIWTWRSQWVRRVCFVVSVLRWIAFATRVTSTVQRRRSTTPVRRKPGTAPTRRSHRHSTGRAQDQVWRYRPRWSCRFVD